MFQKIAIAITILLLLWLIYWGYRSQNEKPISIVKKLSVFLAIVDLDPSVFDYNPDEDDSSDHATDEKLTGIKFLSYLQRSNLPDESELAMNDEPVHLVKQMRSGVYRDLFIPSKTVTWWWDYYGQYHVRFAFKPLAVTRMHSSKYVVELPAFDPTSGRYFQLR